MGSYKKRKSDNRYEWHQTVDGQDRYLSAKTPALLQEKVKRVADLPIIKEKFKVSEWFEKWLGNIETLKKKATYEQYKTLYKQHIKPVIGGRKMKDIKQYDIQKVIAEMAVKNRHKRVKDKETKKYIWEDTGEKLSTWTMKHTRKVMNIAFSKAFDDKIIPSNPVYKIEIPKRQAKPRKTLKTSELKILFEHAKNTRWYWSLRFLLVTGIRRGELLALRWSDIDNENQSITIDESNSSAGVGDTKSAEVHYVPLSGWAKYYLEKQKEMLVNENNPALLNEELKKADLIFPSEDGTMMKPDSLNSVIDRINKKAGIHVTPHMFRHTFVYMSKGLLTKSELQEALGHDESTTTEDIYGTMLSDTQKVATKINYAFTPLEEEINKKEGTSGKVIPFRKAK